MSENKNRIMLTEEEADKVAGGNLQVNVDSEGNAELWLVNPNMTIAKKFKILTSGPDVYAEIMQKYYTLSGNKDMAMLQILANEKKIK